MVGWTRFMRLLMFEAAYFFGSFLYPSPYDQLAFLVGFYAPADQGYLAVLDF